MPELPISYGAGSVVEVCGADTSTTSGVTAPSSGSNNVKGAWIQLVASTARASNWINLQFHNAPNTGIFGLVDIGIGAGGSEVVVIPNIPLHGKLGGTLPAFVFPLSIPAGVRVAARVQWSSANTVELVAHLIAASTVSSPSPSVVSHYGVTTATSRLANVDPGATAHTKSAWVQLTAATSLSHKALCVLVQSGDGNIAVTTKQLVDIGIGAGGSEVVVIPNLLVSTDSTTDLNFGFAHFFPISVPSGSRIAARAQANVTTDGDRDLYISVMGF